ncbi:MAG: endonuclease/exonuclease/phosphatase family protein [Pseudomonadota bacterium]
MRLVSLNAWGGREWPALRQWVGEIGADILCLQEVIRAPEVSPDWLIYTDAERRLAQRADLFADISACLAGYQSFFAASARGSLRDEAGVEHASEHGQGIWVAPHLSVLDYRQGFLHGSFRTGDWGALPRPRAINGARVSDPRAGAGVGFVNVHGLHSGQGKDDTEDRAKQCETLLQFASALRCSGEASVIAGDFNLLPSSRTFAALGEAGFTDLVVSRGHKDTRTSLYPKPQRYADYLLVNAHLTVTAFDVPETPEVSDHRPLILDFTPYP